MRNIILTVLATLVVAGCSDSDGAASSALADAAPNQDTVPVSVDISKPTTEVPQSGDELQACVAIDAVSITDLAGTLIEWTTKSMSDPYAVNSTQCIPPDSSIPTDNDGYPKFIVIDLYDITGVDLVNLISEQLIPVGEYTSLGLSIIQGSYGDILDSPYSYVGNMVDKHKMEIVDELTFDGLNINIDVPETYTMAFDIRSMIQLINDAYIMKSEGLRIVENTLKGSIFGDIDTSSCPVVDNAYVYLYGADSTQYGDLGSEHAPVTTAKVADDGTYAVPYVSEGSYDVVLVCDGLLDLPDQIDLDIDLDGESPKYTDQYVSSGEDKYLPL
ncbi:hypothetical protein MD588_00440 [Photobacterium sp. SDRW27]|uniref:hypothetical protein n=1 Tax=Photobacterium obscurum TaxID=2829490 RepID=UPI00224368DB|nr:hypothetical protein [Photobacterium obscurum]MCW8327268.1 hypothetical protein [Photobacterium obscurum]